MLFYNRLWSEALTMPYLAVAIIIALGFAIAGAAEIVRTLREAAATRVTTAADLRDGADRTVS